MQRIEALNEAPIQRELPPPAPLNTAEILDRLNCAILRREDRQKPWYYLKHREALELSSYIVQDFTWSILSQLSINYKFQYTEDFWQATLGQLLWTSVVLLVWAPLNVFIWSKFYGEKYKNFAIHGAIFTTSSLATMVPFNYFGYLGKNFFVKRGVNENTAQYLAGLFPGPGTAEGTLQTLITTGLSYTFDPNYKFNAVSFGAGLTPLTYLDGDIWLIVFTAMAGVAKKNVGGLIAQALLVMLSAFVTNYLTMKAFDGIGRYFENRNTVKPRTGINLFQLTKRYEYEPRLHQEEAQRPAV